MLVKFDMMVRAWNSLPVSNLVKIGQIYTKNYQFWQF